MAILTLHNVSKFFGDADNGSEQVVAISDVSFDISAGNFFRSSDLRVATSRRCCESPDALCWKFSDALQRDQRQ
jgi:hypothetical protein